MVELHKKPEDYSLILQPEGLTHISNEKFISILQHKQQTLFMGQFNLKLNSESVQTLHKTVSNKVSDNCLRLGNYNQVSEQ